MKRTIAATTVVLASFASSNVFAQQPLAFAGIPNVNVQYYDVEGSTTDALNKALQAHAFVMPNGERAYGHTQYRLHYAGRHSTGKPCKVEARVEFNATVTLPRLANATSLPETLLIRWRTFMAGLETHEAGHARIAFEGSARIARAIQKAGCGNEHSTADAAIMEIRALEEAYDAQTQHGLTQGAMLR